MSSGWRGLAGGGLVGVGGGLRNTRHRLGVVLCRAVSCRAVPCRVVLFSQKKRGGCRCVSVTYHPLEAPLLESPASSVVGLLRSAALVNRRAGSPSIAPLHRRRAYDTFITSARGAVLSWGLIGCRSRYNNTSRVEA